jgi:DNA-directed RNA polymerase subunit K/omega
MEHETDQEDEVPTPEPLEPAPFIHNRFLFVDIAALRAKQLRRGARPRLDHAPDHHPIPHKAERVAMEEVRRQKVYFDLPPAKPAVRNENS